MLTQSYFYRFVSFKKYAKATVTVDGETYSVELPSEIPMPGRGVTNIDALFAIVRRAGEVVTMRVDIDGEIHERSVVNNMTHVSDFIRHKDYGITFSDFYDEAYGEAHTKLAAGQYEWIRLNLTPEEISIIKDGAMPERIRTLILEGLNAVKLDT